MEAIALAHGSPDEVDGEPVLLAADLSDRWDKYRCCQCTAMPLVAGPVGVAFWLIFAPLYACVGPAARREERDSFQLLLTPTSLLFRQKKYGCGCCCQVTTQKSIPLDKIQDINIVSDCCGDCCGFSDGASVPWRMEVQTAGFSGGDKSQTGAELTVFCLRDLTEFRRAVLSARRALVHGSYAGPAAKGDTPASSLHPSAPPASRTDSSRAADTLERMEALMRDAFTVMGAADSGATAATSGHAGASKESL